MKKYLFVALILSVYGASEVFAKLPIICEVKGVDADTGCLTVVPVTPAGPSITVKVGPSDLNTNYLDKKIKGTLITEFNPLQLQDIRPYDPEFEKQVNEINQMYLPDSLTPQSLSRIKIGKPIPPFALYDQNGNPMTHKEVDGKIVVMNFIFTRCADPTLCPAATKKMGELQKLVKKQALHNNVKFVTISFDPENDTPEVLSQYAKGFEIDLSNYSFLTGDPEMVKRLTKLFGIFTVSKKGTINHTMKTVVIDKTGKVIYESSKANWEPEKLLAVIKKI